MTYYAKPKEPVFKDAAERQSAYKELFRVNELGKRVLKDLLNEGAMDRTAFAKDSDSQTYYNLGKQHLCFHILNVMEIKLQQLHEDL